MWPRSRKVWWRGLTLLRPRALLLPGRWKTGSPMYLGSTTSTAMAYWTPLSSQVGYTYLLVALIITFASHINIILTRNSASAFVTPNLLIEQCTISAGADGHADEHVSDEEDHLWVRRGSRINQTMFLSLDPLLLSARSCKCAHEIALLSLEPTTLLITSCRLLAFVVILALANLGKSFASAILAKDTTTANGKLVDINTNKVVATGQAA